MQHVFLVAVAVLPYELSPSIPQLQLFAFAEWLYNALLLHLATCLREQSHDLVTEWVIKMVFKGSYFWILELNYGCLHSSWSFYLFKRCLS